MGWMRRVQKKEDSSEVSKPEWIESVSNCVNQFGDRATPALPALLQYLVETDGVKRFKLLGNTATLLKRLLPQQVDPGLREQLLVIAKVAVEAYFVAELGSSRRVLMELAATCQKLLGEEEGSVKGFLEHDFSQFLSAPSDGEPPCHKLDIIFQSAQPESKFTSGAAARILPSFVHFFDKMILEWVSTAECLPPAAESDPVLMAALMTSLATLGKIVVLLVKFHREAFLNAASAKSPHGNLSFSQNTQLGLLFLKDLVPLNSTWRNLLGGFLSVLFDQRYTKDTQFMASMAFSSLLDLTGAPTVVAERWLALYFPTLSPLVAQSHSEPVIPDTFVCLTACRGLLTIADKKTLLSEIMILDPSQKQGEPIRGSLLVDVIFPGICLQCDQSIHDAPSKVVSFQTLGTWVKETYNIIETEKKAGQKTLDLASIFSPAVTQKLTAYIWDLWEDTFEGVSHQIRDIFDVLVKIYGLLDQESGRKVKLGAVEIGEKVNELAVLLVNSPWHCKYKFWTLTTLLTGPLPSQAILEMSPDFVVELIQQFSEAKVLNRVSDLFFAFLKSQKDHLRNTLGEKEASQSWTSLWLLPLTHMLCCDDEDARLNIETYALQQLVKLDTACLSTIISLLQQPEAIQKNQPRTLKSRYAFDPKNQHAALVLVVSVGKSLGVPEMERFLDDARPENEALILRAAWDSQRSVRLDVLNLLCVSNKSSSAVSRKEFGLLLRFLASNMTSPSSEFRQKEIHHVEKLLRRLRDHNYNLWKDRATMLAKFSIEELPAELKAKYEMIMEATKESKELIDSLFDFLTASLYPGCSFQRSATTIGLLVALKETFGVKETPKPKGYVKGGTELEFPFQLKFSTAWFIDTLMDLLLDSFDKNRNAAFGLLKDIPGPYPGIETPDQIQTLLNEKLSMANSPRGVESDSGALTVRLLFLKYSIELGLFLSVTEGMSLQGTGCPKLYFLKSMLQTLRDQLKMARADLLLAAQQNPLFGLFNCLRYCLTEIDFNGADAKERAGEWKIFLRDLIETVYDAVEIVKPVLTNSSPEGNLPEIYQDDNEEMDEDGDADDMEVDDEVGPKHQVIASCCWRTVKAATLLLSSLLTMVVSPLPSSSQIRVLIGEVEVTRGGRLYLDLLMSMRHLGAFTSVYTAYSALCAQLLNSKRTEFAQIPRAWLLETLDGVTAKNNISITRRSAGLPYCLLGVLCSESTHPSASKDLMGIAVSRLLEIASQPLPAEFDQRIDLVQVHAFNMLRGIFRNSILAQRVLPHLEDGVILAIKGFSSSSWAIRNCSTMLFSVLLGRIFGVNKNAERGDESISGREFFNRFQRLQPFLLSELREAVEQLTQKQGQLVLHPGLYPVLTLLSRFSISNLDEQERISVLADFVPLVMRCSSSAIFQVREMASKALVPLLPTSKVVQFCEEVLEPRKINAANQNQLAGSLLQVRALLAGHLLRIPGSDFAKGIVQKIFPLLEQNLGVGFSEKNPCNLSKAAFLRLLSEYLIDAQWTEQDIDEEKRAETLALFPTDFAVRVVNLAYRDIFEPWKGPLLAMHTAQQQLAQIVMDGVTQFQPELLSQTLLKLMSHSTYEVRLTTYRKTKALLSHPSLDLPSISAALVQRLISEKETERETNLECLVAALNIISDPQMRGVPSQSVPKVWDFVMAHTLSGVGILEAQLPFIGSLLVQLIPQYQAGSLSLEYFSKCLAQWSRLLSLNGHQDKPLPIRTAVVKSLRALTLQKNFVVTRHPETVESSIVDLWLLLVTLLQDDDEGNRESSAEIISLLLTDNISAGPTRALELCFSHLSQAHGQSRHCLQTLVNLASGSAVQSIGALLLQESSPSKKLFLVDDTNYFKEPVLQTQLAHGCVQAILSTSKHADVAPLIQAEATKATAALKEVAQILSSPTFLRLAHLTSKKEIFENLTKIIAHADTMLRPGFERGLLGPALIQDLEASLRSLATVHLHPLLRHSLISRRGSLFELVVAQQAASKEVPVHFADSFLIADVPK